MSNAVFFLTNLTNVLFRKTSLFSEVVFQTKIMFPKLDNEMKNIIYSQIYLKRLQISQSSQDFKSHTCTLYHTYRGMTMHLPAAALISVRCGRDNVCVATLEQRQWLEIHCPNKLYLHRTTEVGYCNNFYFDLGLVSGQCLCGF